MKFAKIAVPAVVLSAIASPAFADATATATSAANTFSSDGAGAITAIGAAMLGLAGIAVVFKWAKAAFFG